MIDMIRFRLPMFLGSAILLGCARSQPPTPRPVPPPTTVATSFGKTWEAAIDALAARSVSIATLDRSSGLIIAEPVRVGAVVAQSEVASCGRKGQLYFAPTGATYNVVVRGDSSRSTVKATIQFNTTDPRAFECVTTGLWEGGVEREIAERAEGRFQYQAAQARYFVDSDGDRWRVDFVAVGVSEALHFTSHRDELRVLERFAPNWASSGNTELRDMLRRADVIRKPARPGVAVALVEPPQTPAERSDTVLVLIATPADSVVLRFGDAEGRLWNVYEQGAKETRWLEFVGPEQRTLTPVPAEWRGAQLSVLRSYLSAATRVKR